ncbi:Uncharacterised protein [Segatella copri]|nr:Uncharacterised protein [Segatella copri]
MLSQGLTDALASPCSLLNPCWIIVLRNTSTIINLVVCCYVECHSFRSLSFVLLIFLSILIITWHSQLHSLRFAQRCTQHEERDKQHEHIHHRRKVYADIHFLLFAFFLCHLFVPLLF